MNLRKYSLAAIIIAHLATACGLDGVVGGACKSGYTETAGQCLLSPSNTSPTFDPKDRTTTGTPISAPSPAPATAPATTAPPATPYHPDITSVPTGFDPGVPVTPTPVTPAPGLVCTPPLVACHGVCIAVEDDPRNCGACGRICASNICVARECQGATPGDVVLIGHDMRDAWTGSVQGKLLANAVSIPTTDPIRVLSYETGGDAESAAWSRYLLSVNISRKVEITTASDVALDNGALYASYDVVLMQGAGSDPAGLGSRWSGPLQTFTKKGGVFVALDTGSADIPALINATGMLGVSGHFALPSSAHYNVTGASNVVGRQLLSPFASFGATVGFTGVDAQDADVTWVVRLQGDPTVPTVIHKIAR